MGAPWIALFVVAVLVATGLGTGTTATARAFGGASISAVPSHLGVAVATQPNFTYSDATVVVRAWVTGGGFPIANATVTFA